MSKPSDGAVKAADALLRQIRRIIKRQFGLPLPDDPRPEQVDSAATIIDRLAVAEAVKPLVEALQKIATGDGVYGAQAHEYKQIARAALAPYRQRGADGGTGKG